MLHVQLRIHSLRSHKVRKKSLLIVVTIARKASYVMQPAHTYTCSINIKSMPHAGTDLGGGGGGGGGGEGVHRALTCSIYLNCVY